MTNPANPEGIKVVIQVTNGAGPSGKLADAEIHFTAGPFAGLKLLGFAIWERRNGPGRNVTFPSRTYSVNGERRSFALLRPNYSESSANASNAARDLVLAAYADHLAAVDQDAQANQAPTQDTVTPFAPPPTTFAAGTWMPGSTERLSDQRPKGDDAL